MAPPDARRDSFVQFVMAPAAGKSTKAKSGGAVATAWERLAHSAALLGYGQLTSFVVVVFVAWLGGREWTEGGGVSRLERGAALRGLVAPFSVAYAVATWLNIRQSSTYPTAGPRLAKVPLLVGLGLVPAHYGIQAAVLAAGILSLLLSVDVCNLAMLPIVDHIVRANLLSAYHAPTQTIVEKLVHMGRSHAPNRWQEWVDRMNSARAQFASLPSIAKDEVFAHSFSIDDVPFVIHGLRPAERTLLLKHVRGAVLRASMDEAGAIDAQALIL